MEPLFDCPTCRDAGQVANGLPSNGPDPCPRCSEPLFDDHGRCMRHGRLDCPPCEAREHLIVIRHDETGQPVTIDGEPFVAKLRAD